MMIELLVWFGVGFIAFIMRILWFPDELKSSWGDILSMFFLCIILGGISLIFAIVIVSEETDFLSKPRNFPWIKK